MTTEIKDGLGNEFTLLTKDLSTTSPQDNSLRASRPYATLYPLEYGIGGSYRVAAKSGTMAAGLSGDSPVMSFRWTSSTLIAVVRRLRLYAWSLGTGFTAGVANFDLFVARSFTASDTNGSIIVTTNSNGKLRTSMAAMLAEVNRSTTAALTAGTRTLSADPIESFSFNVTNATNTPFASQELLACPQGEHPLVLAVNEGFVVQATVPATGTWKFAITPEWDEVPAGTF